jgi:hypothetical protein
MSNYLWLAFEDEGKVGKIKPFVIVVVVVLAAVE